LQGQQAVGVVKKGWEWVGPGGKLHPEEFLERFHGHLVIEALLAIVIVYLFLQQSFKWSNQRSPKLLSEEVGPLAKPRAVPPKPTPWMPVKTSSRERRYSVLPFSMPTVLESLKWGWNHSVLCTPGSKTDRSCRR